MREAAPGPAKDLRRLARVHEQRQTLDQEWLALVNRLRSYDPPVPWTRIGLAAGGMTDGGVINAVRRAEKAAARATGSVADVQMVDHTAPSPALATSQD